MIKLDQTQIIEMHEMLIREIGGKEGVRDYGLLDSALKTPFQTFGGQELYPTIEQKAARLCLGLINNHAFYDGNKRIGILAFLTFLEINGVKVNYTDKELIDMGLAIACGEMHFEDILESINAHKQIDLEQEI